MIAQGKVHSVETYHSGTKVVNAYAAGATVLEVADAMNLQEVGGVATILGVEYTYGLDPEALIMVIDPGLATSIEEGEIVLAEPASMEKRAFVLTDDGEDAVIATVPHSLQADFDEGIREEDSRETVLVEEVRGAWVVKDIVALEPLSEIRLWDAISAALAAQGTADTAQTTADGKNKVYYSTSAPGATANTPGDIWFQRDPAAPTNIIALWVGTGGTSWMSMPITNSMIVNLDAGKITSGYLDVANRLMAGSIVTPLLAAGAATMEKLAFGVLRRNLVADGSFEETYPLTSWDPFDSIWGNEDQWRVAPDGTNSPTLPSRTTVLGSRSRSGSRALEMPCGPSQSSMVASNSFEIKPGSQYRVLVHASALVGDGVLYADLQVGANRNDIFGFEGAPLEGDSTWAAVVPMSTEPLPPEAWQQFSYTFTAPAGRYWGMLRISNGPLGTATLLIDDVSVVEMGVGGATEITAAGIRIFDDEGMEAIALVSNRPNYFSISRDGELLASVSDAGLGSFSSASIDGEDSNADGVPDIGFEVYGEEFSHWVGDEGPGKVVAQAYYSANYTSPTISTEMGIAEISWDCKANRSYIVVMNGIQWHWNTSECMATVGLRYTVDGSAPSITSQVWEFNTARGGMAASQLTTTPPIIGQFSLPTDCVVRMLLTIRRSYGTGTIQWRNDAGTNAVHNPRLMIVEGGADVMESWVGNPGGGTYAAGGAGGAGPAAPRKPYVKTYRSVASGTYKGDGTKRTNTTDVVQGYYGSNGNGDGLWTFPSMTADLAGASISKIEVYAYANSWYYNNGGTARIHVHNYSTVPASNPTLTYALQSAAWPKPGGRWVTLPSSFHAGFQAGTYKGFGMGPAPSNGLIYYGRFSGGLGAQIRVTYVK